jgi:phytol kinase
VPLLLTETTTRLESLLIAVLLAWVAALFEAVAWGGLDNLALPVVSHLLLRAYLDLTGPDGASELGMRLAVTGGLMVLVLAYRSRTTLQGSAVLGAVLVGYLCWSLGGWRWVLPPVSLFLAYPLLSSPGAAAHPQQQEEEPQQVHNVHAVICVTAAGLFWLFVYRVTQREQMLYPFTLAFACQLGLIAVARLAYDYPLVRVSTLLTWSVLFGWAIVFLPYLALSWSWKGLEWTAAALPAVAFSAVSFYLTEPDVHNCPADAPRYVRQGLNGAVGSAVGLIPLFAL